MLKRKLTDEEKVKTIYSGELVIIAIVLFVFATLELTGVFNPYSRRVILHIITLCGATFILGDFIWALVSKKRRKKVAFLDKIVMLPVSLYMITFNIIAFINAPNARYYQVGLSIAFIYIAVIYLFLSIYHYIYPIPGLLEALEEDKKKDDKEIKEVKQEENNDTETKNSL